MNKSIDVELKAYTDKLNNWSKENPLKSFSDLKKQEAFAKDLFDKLSDQAKEVLKKNAIEFQKKCESQVQ